MLIIIDSYFFLVLSILCVRISPFNRERSICFILIFNVFLFVSKIGENFHECNNETQRANSGRCLQAFGHIIQLMHTNKRDDRSVHLLHKHCAGVIFRELK